MNDNCKTILTILEEYLEKHPQIRFCQALHNLNITQFADPRSPETKGFLLRDSYNDSDEAVLERIQLPLTDEQRQEAKERAANYMRLK